MHVSICIPYTEKKEMLQKALFSIQKYTLPEMYNIFILDNGSKKKVVTNNKKIKVYNSPENLGFGRGLNLLITEALKINQDTHILVLNDDIEALPNWLVHLENCMTTHPKAGVIGSTCFYPNGRIQHAGAFINRLYTGQHFQTVPSKATEFEYIPFVCVLLANSFVRTMIAHEGSVFDEKILKAYSEDVDVCYSARKYGYTCILEPKSQIIHHEGSSQKLGILGSNQEIQLLQQKNKEYVARKWEGADYTDKTKKYKVCFVARVAGQLSYQQVLKNIAPRLDDDANFDVSILPEETVYASQPLPPEWKLRKLRLKAFDPNKICIRYCEGEYGYLAYNRDVIYSTLENWGDHIPHQWKHNINLFKQCWVTSHAVKDTYQRAGVTIPIKVIPHGIDLDVWNYATQPYYNPHMPKFMFFINDMYGSRKNIDSAVCAFINCFKDNQNVGLYIQSSNLSTQLSQLGYGKGTENIPGQETRRKRIYNNWLNQLGWQGKTQIFINEDWIDQDTLVSLYARANAVIAIGNEGFGLCGIQTLAMKKPLIYMDIGGVKDYVSEDTGYPVKVGKLVPSRQLWLMQNYINGIWAEPNFDDLKAQLLEVYNHHDQAVQKANNGYKNIRYNFSWKTVIQKIKTSIKEIS